MFETADFHCAFCRETALEKVTDGASVSPVTRENCATRAKLATGRCTRTAPTLSVKVSSIPTPSAVCEPSVHTECESSVNGNHTPVLNLLGGAQ